MKRKQSKLPIPASPTENSESDPDNDKPETTEPAFQNAEKIIQNFDKFGYDWQPDQKETLYTL